MRDPRPTVMRTLEEQVDPKHAALVIIDVQNDFVHPEGIYAKQAGELWQTYELIPRMLENLPPLLRAARRANCLVVFVRGIYDPKYTSEPFAFILEQKELYGELCCSGTFGADFYGDIRPAESPREFVVTKHNYSAFWGTDLDTILRSNGVKTVVMTGTASSGCVESTTRDAFFNDYYTVTVEDCCAERRESHHKVFLDKMAASCGYVVNSKDLIDTWSEVRLGSSRDRSTAYRQSSIT